jgi:predicted glycogen debranching enzyme
MFERVDRVHAVAHAPVSGTPADEIAPDAEWLESDGRGGFASGPVLGARTRRYHALLLTATTPPTGRIVQVNGVEAYVEGDADDAVPLSTNRYAPDILHPRGWRHVLEFTSDPWPTWTFGIADGVTVQQEIFVARDSCETVLRWRSSGNAGRCRLRLRLLMSGRDYHALHRENGVFDFRAKARQGGNVSWRPYAGLPAVTALTNGEYLDDPVWFRDVLYAAERDRGLDDVEDVASPGSFTWDLGAGPAILVLRSGDSLNVRTQAYAAQLVDQELGRRSAATSPLRLAADSYLVDRRTGRTVLAGFPWFTDWGRDTFIAMRGLVIALGRFSEAEAILGAWAGTVSEGMLPNRFVDSGDIREFNSVDASLWFVIAGHELLEAARQADYPIAPKLEECLIAAFDAILHAYAEGTRYGISADGDGLLRAGTPGVQLTWMDAKIGDWVVTPRIGKPVEIQALWINALRIGRARSARLADLEQRARTSFAERFPNPENGGLFDVVDVDHVAGAVDAKVRPNQIFAVGGLPFAVLEGPRARGIVELVESRLLTPLGLRSLAPDDPDYRPYYGGDPRHRDGAYHQGTVWPWLMGAFVEAWLRTSADPMAALAEARARFLPPLLSHLRTAGLGHVSEIADGDPPHAPRGCPFQAWSLGELIRIVKALQPAPGLPPL